MRASGPRLLLILTEWPPAVGGMQTHARYLAAHFARQASAIEVLTYRVTDPGIAAPAREFDRHCDFPIRRVLSRLGFWHNQELVLRRMREFRPDAVYASTVFYGLLRPRSGVPVVCRSVGNDVLRPWLGYPYPWCSRLVGSSPVQRAFSWWLEHGQHPDWVDRVFREGRDRLMRRAALAHHGILANSDYTAGLLRGIGVDGARIDVVPGGVDAVAFNAPPGARAAARQALGLRADDQVILTVCRLVEKKGVEVLLDALARLQPRLPGLKLLVVGDGRRRKAYEARAARLGVHDLVRFEGRVPHEQIARYYWASDAFALASYESQHAGGAVRDVETMGRVLCEANAAGVPVVATASGGTPSVLQHGHNGLLVPPCDAEALANALASVLRTPAQAGELVRNGLRRAQHEFDWAAVMARHEAAVAQSLARHVPSQMTRRAAC